MLSKKRISERVYPQRERAAFGVGYGSWLSPARIADYSASGIGLEVNGFCQARFGDAIRVIEGQDGGSRHARVVRLSDERRGGRSVTRLGCRWITASNRRERLHGNPARSAGHAPETGARRAANAQA